MGRHSKGGLAVAATGVALLAAAVSSAATVTEGGSSGPAAFELIFDGKHNADLLHEGTFTSSASFCPSGSAADVSIDDQTLTAARRFTCDASSGDFTAKVTPLPAEHGGSGTWRIVAGSGPLADLRGKGTWTSVRLSGNPIDPASITFRSTWKGLVDFDTGPPTIAVSSASARKLRRPIGAYRLRLVLALSDAGGGSVSYLLTVTDPRKPLWPLAAKSGETGTGGVSYTLRVRPTKRTHFLRLQLDASDAVGNEAALARTLRLR